MRLLNIDELMTIAGGSVYMQYAGLYTVWVDSNTGEVLASTGSMAGQQGENFGWMPGGNEVTSDQFSFDQQYLGADGLYHIPDGAGGTATFAENYNTGTLISLNSNGNGTYTSTDGATYTPAASGTWDIHTTGSSYWDPYYDNGPGQAPGAIVVAGGSNDTVWGYGNTFFVQASYHWTDNSASTLYGSGVHAKRAYTSGYYGVDQGEDNFTDKAVSAWGNGDGSVTYLFGDGTEYVTPTGLALDVRDNNPGNVKYGQDAINWGAIGKDGAFAIFPTASMGFNAMSADDERINNLGYADTGLTNTAANLATLEQYAPASSISVNSWDHNLTIHWTPGQATLADITIANTPFNNGNNQPTYLNNVINGMNAQNYNVTANTQFNSLVAGTSASSYFVNVATQEGYYSNGGR